LNSSSTSDFILSFFGLFPFKNPPTELTAFVAAPVTAEKRELTVPIRPLFS